MAEVSTVLDALSAAGPAGLLLAASVLRRLAKQAVLARGEVTQLMQRVERSLDDAEAHRARQRQHWNYVESRTHDPTNARPDPPQTGGPRPPGSRSGRTAPTPEPTVPPSSVPSPDGIAALQGTPAGMASAPSLA